MSRDKKKPLRADASVYVAKLHDKPVRMRAMSGREIIALRRGKMDEADVMEMTASAVLFPLEDLELEDPLDLDYDELTALLDTWGDAMKEKALPNSSGEPSA